MSVKAVLRPYKVIEDGDMSGTVIGLASQVESTDNIAYQVKFTGSPEGDFFVDGTINGTDWDSLEFSTPPTATGVPGSFLININQFPYSQIRLRYEPTASTGVLQAWIMAKRLGG